VKNPTAAAADTSQKPETPNLNKIKAMESSPFEKSLEILCGTLATLAGLVILTVLWAVATSV
jgi:hypothetical protein